MPTDNLANAGIGLMVCTFKRFVISLSSFLSVRCTKPVKMAKIKKNIAVIRIVVC